MRKLQTMWLHGVGRPIVMKRLSIVRISAVDIQDSGLQNNQTVSVEQEIMARIKSRLSSVTTYNSGVIKIRDAILSHFIEWVAISASREFLSISVPIPVVWIVRYRSTLIAINSDGAPAFVVLATPNNNTVLFCIVKVDSSDATSTTKKQKTIQYSKRRIEKGGGILAHFF